MKTKEQGVSLIEAIIFLIIIGLAMLGIKHVYQKLGDHFTGKAIKEIIKIKDDIKKEIKEEINSEINEKMKEYDKKLEKLEELNQRLNKEKRFARDALTP